MKIKVITSIEEHEYAIAVGDTLDLVEKGKRLPHLRIEMPDSNTIVIKSEKVAKKEAREEKKIKKVWHV